MNIEIVDKLTAAEWEEQRRCAERALSDILDTGTDFRDIALRLMAVSVRTPAGAQHTCMTLAVAILRLRQQKNPGFAE